MMLHAFAAPGTVIAVAILNRAAGNDLFGFCKRGKPAVYVMPLIGLIAYAWVGRQAPIAAWPFMAWAWLGAVSTYQLSIAWAVSYLEWRVWPHGRWLDLEDDPTDPNRIGIAMDWFERAITAVSFGSDLLALFFRHLTAWPGFVLIWLAGGPGWLLYTGPPFAAALALSHYLARAISRQNFHFIAELFHGALWGALIFASAP